MSYACLDCLIQAQKSQDIVLACVLFTQNSFLKIRQDDIFPILPLSCLGV